MVSFFVEVSRTIFCKITSHNLELSISNQTILNYQIRNWACGSNATTHELCQWVIYLRYLEMIRIPK